MITLTTSAQVLGTSSNNAWKAELYGWYSGQSGNTATVHIALRVTYIEPGVQTYVGTNKNYSLTFNGTSAAQYPNSMTNGEPVWITDRTQSMAGGSTVSASASWSCYSYSNLSVSPSDTTVLPAFIIPPTTPSLTVTNNNAHQNTISFGTSSFGNPSTGNIKLWVANNPSFTSETLLQTKTTTGLFTYTHTGLTANTTYYYRTKATNGSADSSYVSQNVTTRRATYVPDENEETKLVQNLEVSFNGLSKNVLKLYRGNADDEAERIY